MAAQSFGGGGTGLVGFDDVNLDMSPTATSGVSGADTITVIPIFTPEGGLFGPLIILGAIVVLYLLLRK